jgi:signal transduction histidine kinase
VAAFAYICVTIIVALTIPLAITLDGRARTELERENLVLANTIAQSIGAEALAPGRRTALAQIVAAAAEQANGRVIVVDAAGALIGDSDGPASGQLYATSARPELVAALADSPTSIVRHSDTLGTDLMATAVPIVDETATSSSQVVGAVRITRSVDQVNAAVRRVTIAVIGIGAAGLLAGLLLAVFLSGSLARPLRELADRAQRFGAGDLVARAGDIRGPEEVERLAASFDRMADDVADNVRSHREFAANASHQLRTPLAGIKLRIESVVAETHEDRVRADLMAADAEVDRLAAIVDRLLATASRAERRSVRSADLARIALRGVERWRRTASDAGMEIAIEAVEAPARVDERDVEQIFDNLIDNAIRYGAGPIEVSTGVSNGHAFLAVRDHGEGIPPDDITHITDRFYRGAGNRSKGSGLGLAIARELAAHDEGTTSVMAATGGGTLVEVRFPVRAPLAVS